MTTQQPNRIIKLTSKAIWFCIVILLSFLMSSCFNDDEGRKNYDNIQDVKTGMSQDCVITIMGHPKQILRGNTNHNFSSKNTVFVYSNTAFSSDDLNILFDTNGTVASVFSCD